MGLRPLEFFYFFQYGVRLYMSETDVNRRQILTYKDGPRTGRFKYPNCAHSVVVLYRYSDP